MYYYIAIIPCIVMKENYEKTIDLFSKRFLSKPTLLSQIPYTIEQSKEIFLEWKKCKR